MRIRDKIITAACRTTDGIEWTSYKTKQGETARTQQERRTLDVDDTGAPRLPTDLKDQLAGDLIAALPTTDLLMRTMEFPTADPQEIAEMVAFQIDKISPFPQEQLAVSHEILLQTEETALVLMVAAKRSCIDEIGDLFQKQGITIFGIDVRILGWLKLLYDAEKISAEGCEIIIINDGLEMALVVLHNSIPVAFRTLHAAMDDLNVLEELTYEIGYTLTMLDTERDLPSPSSICFWSAEEVAPPLRAQLAKRTGLNVQRFSLAELPPLSEGIIRRTRSKNHKLELIPQDWVELENRRVMRKKFLQAAAAVCTVWLVVVVAFAVVFRSRHTRLANTRDETNRLAPQAQAALQDRQKLKTLKVYTDRSDSSIECLREATNLLPPGDIEFAAYKYTKGKGVTLRGTAETDDLALDYLKKLSASELFMDLKDDSVNKTVSKGKTRYVFSVTMVLAEEAR